MPRLQGQDEDFAKKWEQFFYEDEVGKLIIPFIILYF